MGETPIKRALGDESRYPQRKEVKELMHYGTLTNEKAEIIEAFVKHYRDLLGKRVSMAGGSTDVFLPIMPKLYTGTQEKLGAPISVQEIQKSIDDLNTGKMFGPDGIGAEFYQKFKEEIEHAL